MSDTIVLYENGKAVGGEGHPTNADEITFNNEDTDLVSEEVESAIKEVNAKFDKGSVEVVGNGSKSYKTLLSELSALIDGTKITHNTALKIGNFTYRLLYEQDSSYLFSFAYADTTSVRVQSANVAGSNSTLYLSVNNSITNMTNNVASNGIKFTLYY